MLMQQPLGELTWNDPNAFITYQVSDLLEILASQDLNTSCIAVQP